jgi:integrase/recombinase XerD
LFHAHLTIEGSVALTFFSVALKRLLDVASAACSPYGLLDAYVLRALILILYGACLRHGEALRLTMQDVNLDEAVLHVRERKFYRSRLVPLGKR